METLIDKTKLPDGLKKMSLQELNKLASEIREYMIKTVADNGGHLAASLGVVELAVALHSHYQSPVDRIVWDVGHQSYPHKLLTGRWDQFATLRQADGLCGFPKPSESPHDAFATGHSSTSISAALGLAKARDHRGEKHRVIAVIGDGALTGGMSFEALNHAGHIKANITVILNDNEMSIGSNVGSLSAYLGRIRSDPKYSRLKKDYEYYLSRVPLFGNKILNLSEKIKNGLKYLVVPGMIFEELGFTYLGPVDGHNIKALKTTLRQADQLKGPVLVHVITEKGKGYSYAENAPEQYHGVAPFDLSNGMPLKKKKLPSYTEIFGETLLEIAAKDDRVVALTAAMAGGTGLKNFSETFPDRFYDVGIAEQHAVTMAAALAAGGMRPVFAVYSTFLQRAYDQVLHDVSMQNLPVIFAVDRAGIVGEDGETHQGLFDISYLRSIPNMTVMAPSSGTELKEMLYSAFLYNCGPIAIRYPRDVSSVSFSETVQPVPYGKGNLVRSGEDLLILTAGAVTTASVEAAEKLYWQGIKTAVINSRFIKPLDEELIAKWLRNCSYLLTVEENVLAGGFGSSVLELCEKLAIPVTAKRLGINDAFVAHGTRAEVLKCHGLDSEGIYRSALELIKPLSARENH